MSGFRMKGSARRTSMLSTFGVVIGGEYALHRYSFLKFSCTSRGALQIELRVTPPAWPFPKEVVLTKAEFRHLEGIPGERAPKVDTGPLIDDAVSAHLKATHGRPSAAARAPTVLRTPKPLKLSAAQETLIARMRAGDELKVSRATTSVLICDIRSASIVPRSTVAALVKANLIRATGRQDEHLNQLYELTEAQPA